MDAAIKETAKKMVQSHVKLTARMPVHDFEYTVNVSFPQFGGRYKVPGPWDNGKGEFEPNKSQTVLAFWHNENITMQDLTNFCLGHIYTPETTVIAIGLLRMEGVIPSEIPFVLVPNDA